MFFIPVPFNKIPVRASVFCIIFIMSVFHGYKFVNIYYAVSSKKAIQQNVCGFFQWTTVHFYKDSVFLFQNEKVPALSPAIQEKTIYCDLLKIALYLPKRFRFFVSF